VSDRTSIEWTDATWNVVRGCSRVSTGCTNCYAERQAVRQAGPGGAYEGLVASTPRGPRWTGRVQLVEELLDAPLRWKNPRRIFVNAMSDLFHEDLPGDAIAAVLGVVERCPQHTFQVLTKRPARMRDFFLGTSGAGAMAPVLPNLWLGVSVENQSAAIARIPDLLATPAVVKFLSVEPLLEAVDLTPWLTPFLQLGEYPLGAHRSLDWVIVGGESGPGARPCHLDWVRSLLWQCRPTVPVFVKQLGRRPMSEKPWVDAAGIWQASCRDRKGGDMDEWPADIRVREFPATQGRGPEASPARSSS
jgi:protein gp37